jgi:hypothetical protein
MSFATQVLVRIVIGAPVAFLLTLAAVWIVDRVFGEETDAVLERVHRTELDEAERDLWDRLAVGADEWIP